MTWTGKKVLIVGLGKSGKAAAVELARLGAEVIACDKKSINMAELKDLSEAGIELVLGRYPDLESIKPDLVITSPGVPSDESPLAIAKKMGIPVWSELEMAFRFLERQTKVAAITGTNGKTTTTSLCGYILQRANLPVVVGGNIGTPLVKAVKDIQPNSYVVTEVSSFMLENIASFHPRVSVILNITPDHLDRHGNMDNYVKAKENIMAFQDPQDFVVLNYDDPLTRNLAKRAKPQVLFFSLNEKLDKGAYLKEGVVCCNLGNGEIKLCHYEELSLKGSHNVQNVMAASLVALALGVNPSDLIEALKTFPGVSHRLELVEDINGVIYINDSKGTNPEATIKALEAYDNPIILIAGGRNKGSDFTKLAQKMVGRVKYLILIGEATGDLELAAKSVGIKDIYRAPDFNSTVLKAAKVAEPGDVVMLSPACASWDMFKSYEERGDLFKKLVAQLPKD